jgi:hypothetical protein
MDFTAGGGFTSGVRFACGGTDDGLVKKSINMFLFHSI